MRTETRLNAAQVDMIFIAVAHDRPIAAEEVEALCRDWLDMRTQLDAAERVVQTARAYWDADASYSDGCSEADPITAMSNMIDAIEDYDLTRPTPDQEGK